MPYLLVVAFITNLLLLGHSMIYQIVFGAQIAFYVGALVGWSLEWRQQRVPLASAMFSFCVANLGMLLGVALAILGRVPTSYEMPHEAA